MTAATATPTTAIGAMTTALLTPPARARPCPPVATPRAATIRRHLPLIPPTRTTVTATPRLRRLAPPMAAMGATRIRHVTRAITAILTLQRPLALTRLPHPLPTRPLPAIRPRLRLRPPTTTHAMTMRAAKTTRGATCAVTTVALPHPSALVPRPIPRYVFALNFALSASLTHLSISATMTAASDHTRLCWLSLMPGLPECLPHLHTTPTQPHPPPSHLPPSPLATARCCLCLPVLLDREMRLISSYAQSIYPLAQSYSSSRPHSRLPLSVVWILVRAGHICSRRLVLSARLPRQTGVFVCTPLPAARLIAARLGCPGRRLGRQARPLVPAASYPC